MSNILLDTNAYGAFLAGDKPLLEALSQAESVAVSVIVLGELHAGFRGGNRRAENEHILAEFLAKPGVSTSLLSPETAQIFGDIKAGLKRAGTPIPINDVWLAAQAIETGRVLVTLDGHFRCVPGLRLWDS
jgi:tRNA(fMet)-specific endonuclease VapC